jgi:hypothetical protein
MNGLVIITNQKEHPENPRNLLCLLRREIKSVLLDLEIQIYELESQNPPGVNPSEQDINAMKKSLN